MIHKLSELLGTVKTKTTPYHPRSDGLVERFNRTLLAMLAMFVSREHDNWDDLLPFMMLAYNTTVHTTTGFTPYRLVFGEECNLPGNLVHRELRPDPPPGDPGTYASWVQQALHESYDEVRAQQQRATHRQKRNYDCKAVARAFPIGCWTLRYYPPARKNKLCSPWIGPYKIVRAPMEWVVRIQVDADARIFYVHMDDLKRCAAPDPEPSWPNTAPGTSIVVSCGTVVLSVIQYALLMDDINKEIIKEDIGPKIGCSKEPIGCLLWMDDVALISNDPKELQKMLNITNEVANRYHIEFGSAKSKILKIGNKTTKPDIYLGEKKLEYTDQYKYLGEMLKGTQKTT